MTIKKVKGGYVLVSKKSGKRLSKVYKHRNSPNLKKRIRQVEFFKKRK